MATRTKKQDDVMMEDLAQKTVDEAALETQESPSLDDLEVDEADTVLPDEGEAVEEEPKKPARARKRSKEAEPSTAGGSRRSFRPESVITVHKESTIPNVHVDEREKWHEIQNAFYTKKMLTGTLSAIERMRIGASDTINVAVVNYGNLRVIIPIEEMNIQLGKNNEDMVRKIKIANNMIGSEVDFVVTHMDESAGAVVASRKQAMEQKKHDFYIEKQDSGEPVITVGKDVEARIIAVAESAVRLEVFGIDLFVRAIDMDAAWIADARDKYYVGGTAVVRVQNINIKDGQVVSIEVDGKCIALETQKQESCSKNGKYLGEVTGVHNGIYFIRLTCGVNAISHTCQVAGRKPAKKDRISFACTRMDEEQHVAIGIITKVVQRAEN